MRPGCSIRLVLLLCTGAGCIDEQGLALPLHSETKTVLIGATLGNQDTTEGPLRLLYAVEPEQLIAGVPFQLSPSDELYAWTTTLDPTTLGVPLGQVPEDIAAPCGGLIPRTVADLPGELHFRPAGGTQMQRLPGPPLRVANRTLPPLDISACVQDGAHCIAPSAVFCSDQCPALGTPFPEIESPLPPELPVACPSAEDCAQDPWCILDASCDPSAMVDGTCPLHEARVPGDAACRPMAGPAALNGWPEMIPVGLPTLYVRAGESGSGTSDDPLGSIQTALSMIAPGGLIVIGAGVYDEALVIDRNVRLLGAGTETEVRSTADYTIGLASPDGTVTATISRMLVSGGRRAALLSNAQQLYLSEVVVLPEASKISVGAVVIGNEAVQGAIIADRVLVSGRNAGFQTGAYGRIVVMRSALIDNSGWGATCLACELREDGTFVGECGTAEIHLRRTLHVNNGSGGTLVRGCGGSSFQSLHRSAGQFNVLLEDSSGFETRDLVINGDPSNRGSTGLEARRCRDFLSARLHVRDLARPGYSLNGSAGRASDITIEGLLGGLGLFANNSTTELSRIHIKLEGEASGLFVAEGSVANIEDLRVDGGFRGLICERGEVFAMRIRLESQSETAAHFAQETPRIVVSHAFISGAELGVFIDLEPKEGVTTERSSLQNVRIEIPDEGTGLRMSRGSVLVENARFHGGEVAVDVLDRLRNEDDPANFTMRNFSIENASLGMNLTSTVRLPELGMGRLISNDVGLRIPNCAHELRPLISQMRFQDTLRPIVQDSTRDER